MKYLFWFLFCASLFAIATISISLAYINFGSILGVTAIALAGIGAIKLIASGLLWTWKHRDDIQSFVWDVRAKITPDTVSYKILVGINALLMGATRFVWSLLKLIVVYHVLFPRSRPEDYESNSDRYRRHMRWGGGSKHPIDYE